MFLSFRLSRGFDIRPCCITSALKEIQDESLLSIRLLSLYHMSYGHGLWACQRKRCSSTFLHSLYSPRYRQLIRFDRLSLSQLRRQLLLYISKEDENVARRCPPPNTPGDRK